MVFDEDCISPDQFIDAAKEFVAISHRINDQWKLYENNEIHKNYISKEDYVVGKNSGVLYKAEFVVFYHLSYGVPSFSFNIWDSSGYLLTLEDIRQMSIIELKKEDFYSVITQQEHPILCRPYFIMHPCHTKNFLHSFPETKNIIVTFLGLVMPLLNLNLPMEYGKV